MTIDEVLDLQKKIEKCKNEKAQLEGEKKAILKQLQDDWDCKSVKQANGKANELNEEILTLADEIALGLEQLEIELNTTLIPI